ncbi:MAG: ATP citrate-lyase, partial [Olpidium bornovanus]
MSAKSIREYDGKLLLAHWLLKSPAVFPDAAATSEGECFVPPAPRVASVNLEAVVGACAADAVGIALAQEFARLEALHPWLLTCKLVAKPDQLIKRRGKGGLLLLNASWKEVQRWIVERAGKDVTVDGVSGVLKAFIVEPFVPHGADTEHYVCIHSERNEDTILFTHEGGIDVGDVDAKADRITVPVTGPFPSDEKLRAGLLRSISDVRKQRALADFIKRLYNVYVDLHFTYLEINPLVVLEPVSQDDLPRVVYLDLAAKLDQTAEFESGPKWAIARCLSAAFQASNSVDARTAASGAGAPMVDVGPPMEFPPPFGRDLTKEEAYIASLDAKTGASLKLTVLNKNGRIWTMVAGGGASVVYSDAIAALGYAHELANYGEYSGAPSETQTYEYAKTILDLMTRSPTPHPDGKVLLIGGGIANFTNVAATFKGIVRALKQYQRPLQAHNVQVYVRRGGPNYQEGLSLMRQLGESMGVPIHVFGPETHVTAIVPLALAPFSQAKANGSLAAEQERITADLDIVSKPKLSPVANGSPAANGSPVANGGSAGEANGSMAYFPSENGFAKAHPWYAPFTENTRALVYGMQPRAVQGMLDFDFICKRKTPSVAAMIYPFGGAHVQKFYWGTQETLLPVFTTIDDALAKFPEVDCVVNFASCRSVYESTMEMLAHGDKIRSIAIIAEGVPERRARQIIAAAKAKGVLIIGPATVGGIKPGCFKVGNTGGMMDNIVSSKLYRPGSVAYVSKSGGM